MNDEEKLRIIYDSYINGQRGQMVDQIKDYGVARFHVDFYEHLGQIAYDGNRIAQYAAVVHTFHLINQTRRK